MDIPRIPHIGMHVTVWEDNSGTLIRTTIEPGCMTPDPKQLAIKYHWFQFHLVPNGDVEKIASDNQKADMLTTAMQSQRFCVKLTATRLLGSIYCLWQNPTRERDGEYNFPTDTQSA